MARSSISAVNVLESRYTHKKHTHSCLMCCNIRIAQRLVSRIFNNLNKSQSQAGEAEMNCSPHHPQWWNTACRRNTHTHTHTHTHTLSCLHKTPWSEWERVGHHSHCDTEIDRHTLTHGQNTWCAIGFVGTWRHKNIHMELIVTVEATS